jgi:hypothetical protein
MKKIASVFSFLLLVGLSGCGIDGHNQAELRPVNADSERIYGEIGGPAKQTLNKYKDDETGEVQQRIAAIRTKLFPK